MPKPELPDDDVVPALRHWGESAAAAPVVAGAAAPERKHIHKWGQYDFLRDDRACACGANKSVVDREKRGVPQPAADA